MLAILVLVLGLMFWAVPIVHGAQYLTINGQDVNAITVELGKLYSVEVTSTDSSPYLAYAGFDSGEVLGTFSHLETKPAAGNLAAVFDYNQPTFYGYYFNATGIAPAPSAGVHFVFEYVALQLGITYVKLYDSALTSLIDSVHITVIPLQPVAMGTAFTYQGRLMDDNEAADGLYDFQFKLYDNADPVFATQQGSTIDINDLDVVEGQFAITLDFGGDVFDGNAVWLETTVAHADGSDPCTFTPRVELTPTPYALYARAAGADNDWAVSGTDMYSLPTGNIGIGTTTPRASLEVTNTGSSHAIWASTSRIPVYALRTATSGTWPAVAGDCNSLASGASGIRGRILSTNPGVLSAGVYGWNYGTGSNGVGVRGHHNGSGAGVHGTAIGSDGMGVYGEATNSNSQAINYGGYFKSAGGWGSGVCGLATGLSGSGVKGVSTDIFASGVHGIALGGGSVGVSGEALNAEYSGTGGYFKAIGESGRGVDGYASGNDGRGVLGTASGINGRGVYGHATGSSGKGVYGEATGNNGVGVYGEGIVGTNVYAGYFKGNVYMTSNCSALSFTDRTPYPKNLLTAYRAVMSMERLPESEYEEQNKQHQLDHSRLDDFIRSKDGNRDLSATVSCLNEVVKDLVQRLSQKDAETKALTDRLSKLELLQKENADLYSRIEKLETILAAWAPNSKGDK